MAQTRIPSHQQHLQQPSDSVTFEEAAEDLKRAMMKYEQEWERIEEAHRNEPMEISDWAKLSAEHSMGMPQPSTRKFFLPAMAGLIMETPPKDDQLAQALGLDVWHKMVETEVVRLAAARTTWS